MACWRGCVTGGRRENPQHSCCFQRLSASYLRPGVCSELFLTPGLCPAITDSDPVAQLVTFFSKLPRSHCFITAIGQQLREKRKEKSSSSNSSLITSSRKRRRLTAQQASLLASLRTCSSSPRSHSRKGGPAPKSCPLVHSMYMHIHSDQKFKEK